MITDTVTAGALVRKNLRILLDKHQIAYKEHKGLFESVFVVTASPEVWKALLAWSKATQV